jgi:hypothetical protein
MSAGPTCRLAGAVLAALLLPLLPAGTAGAEEPPTAAVEVEPVLTAGGPGNQTDPHLSGELLVYIERIGTGSTVRWHDLSDDSSGTVDNAGHHDALPDVSGSLVVFRRVSIDGSGAGRPIMLVDLAAPEPGAVELAPLAGARRSQPDIGGTTVAFEQLAGPSSNQSDICVADATAPAAAATCLTTDGAAAFNRDPAVSPDGSVVAFTKCLTTGTQCTVWASRRAPDGSWGEPVRISHEGGREVGQPRTDGATVVYTDFPLTWPTSTGPDIDLWTVGVDGAGYERLPIDDPSSNELYGEVHGDLVTFERESYPDLAGDLWAYDRSRGVFYQLTDTDTDERLHDSSPVGPAELLVAWAEDDGELGSSDIRVVRVHLPQADAEAPALTLPGSMTVDATGPDGAPVSFEVTATDDGGEPEVTCAPEPGTTFAIGTTAVTCIATDAAGNEASGSFEVTVRGAREQLADLLTAVAGVGPGNSLAAKIRAAVGWLPDRALPLTCEPLRAFIREVQAQAGKRIPADQAAALVEDATRIRAVLACR